MFLLYVCLILIFANVLNCEINGEKELRSNFQKRNIFPDLPTALPTLPTGLPTLPTGLPTLPTGLPTLPTALPTLPTLPELPDPEDILPSLSSLISELKYILPTLEQLENCISSINLISPILINNTSPVTIEHEISNGETSQQSMCWQFNQSSILDGILGDVTLPNFNLPQIPSLSQNAKFQLMEGLSSLRKRSGSENASCTSVQSQNTVTKKLTIPPNSAVKVEAILNQCKNLPLNFTAVGVITGKLLTGSLNGTQLAEIISKLPINLDIMNITSDSVWVYLNGFITLVFDIGQSFNVLSQNDDETLF